MSWSINLVGKSSDVKAAAKAVEGLPQPLKDMVAHIADAYEKQPAITGLQVISMGHTDDTYGGYVQEFSVKPVTLVPSVTVTAPTPPQSPPAS